jgi:hypothetical protein
LSGCGGKFAGSNPSSLLRNFAATGQRTRSKNLINPRNQQNKSALSDRLYRKERIMMRKAAIIVAAIAALATATVAPAEARGWRGGWGPGIGFGLLAGALAAGAYGAYGPYGYDGYGPRYYGYGAGPYAYYGGGPYYYGPRRYYRYSYW